MILSIIVYFSIGFGIYLGLLFGKIDRGERVNFGGIKKTIEQQLIFAFLFTLFWIFIILFNMIDRICNRTNGFWRK